MSDAAQSQPVPITASPKHDQLVEHGGVSYRTIKEGSAYILVPSAGQVDDKKPKNGKSEEPQSVFYNPIQQFNRDLSVLAIRAIGQDLVERRSTKVAARVSKQKSKDANKRRKANDGSAIPARLSETVPAEANKAVKPAANGTDATHVKPSVSVEDPPSLRIGFRILDALSATGLRALRYAHEIDFATHITANDLLQTATDAIKLNVQHNKLEDKITANTSDARAYMYKSAYSHGAHDYGKYDVIDLDPYGTAAPFIDAALEAINDGGMLCVTCTDAGVFASSGYLEKSFALYGGLPIKGPHSHEGGLRLVLNAIATAAARYGKSIEPLLSLSIDFYVRIFVRIHRSAEQTKLLAGKTAIVHQCDSGCGSWTVQPIARTHTKTGRSGQEFFKYSSAQSVGAERCVHCGFKTHVAGPMWMGPLHNPFFITKILTSLDGLDKSVYGTIPRIEGMLTCALDEIDVLTEVTRLAEPAVASSGPNDKRPNTTNHTTDTATPEAADATSTPPNNIIRTIPAWITDPHPFHFNPSAISKVLHCVAPSEAALRGALRRLGYVATRSHTKPGTVKTQASWHIIWHVMREWVRQKAPIKVENQKAGTPGWAILGLGKSAAKDVNGLQCEKAGVVGDVDHNRSAENAAGQDTESAGKPQTTSGQTAEQDVAKQGSSTDQSSTAHDLDAIQSVHGRPSTTAPLTNGKPTAKVVADESEAKDTRPQDALPDVVFDMALGADKHGHSPARDGTSKKRKLVRYQSNPRANWGPMSKASAPK